MISDIFHGFSWIFMDFHGFSPVKIVKIVKIPQKRLKTKAEMMCTKHDFVENDFHENHGIFPAIWGISTYKSRFFTVQRAKQF